MAQAGEATFTYRVASDSSGGVIRLEKAGGDVSYGSVVVPNTGGWQVWQNVSHTVSLPAGPQKVAITAEIGGWNLNHFSVSAGGCTDDCNTGGIVQAESFTAMAGVKTEETQDINGGLNVGWIDQNDWMTYDVSLPASSSGKYSISYRVASINGGSFKLEQPGGAVQYGNISFNGTGGWQTWRTVNHTVSLPSGTNRLAIASTSVDGWNFNWFSIKAIDHVATAITACDGVPVYPNWQRNDSSKNANTHQNEGDEMIFDSQLFMANWYTNTKPGSDASWSKVNSCK